MRARGGDWGDLDTWGLMLLGKARVRQPSLAALMMTREMVGVAGRPGVGSVLYGLLHLKSFEVL